MQVEITENKLVARFQYDPAIIADCKQLGMRWNPKNKTWWIPANIQNIELFSDIFPDSGIENRKPINNLFFEIPSYLMRHQKEALKIGRKHNRFGFFDDTGTGKTVTGLNLIRMHNVKALVVCPLSIIENAWIEDSAKFEPDLKIVNLWKISKDKQYNNLLQNCQVGVINFEQFKTQKKQLEKAGFNALLIDESSKIKSQKAAITKELTVFCENMHYVYLFSGTPAPNSELEYFTQIRIINPLLFGRSFYKFRTKYFDAKGYGGFQFDLKEEKRAEFLEKIASVSRVVCKADVVDLPDRTFNVRTVKLNTEERKAYNAMMRHMLLETDGGAITSANAGVKTMKLRQITSGFIIDTDDAGKILKLGTSKINELSDLLDEIGNNQAIIWTQFRYEAELVAKLLTKKNKPFGICNGDVSQSEKQQNIVDFKNGKMLYLIAHPRTIGHGVTLTNCSFSIDFSTSYSYEETAQKNDRIYRIGQKNACTYFSLIAENTIDEVIQRALKNKKKVESEILTYIQNWRG